VYVARALEKLEKQKNGDYRILHFSFAQAGELIGARGIFVEFQLRGGLCLLRASVIAFWRKILTF
jgi:hypothetical protein|tara:strand:- start:67 stop:261 length:195 start_codon:yes stop_codon:yes gene_type:complete